MCTVSMGLPARDIILRHGDTLCLQKSATRLKHSYDGDAVLPSRSPQQPFVRVSGEVKLIDVKGLGRLPNPSTGGCRE